MLVLRGVGLGCEMWTRREVVACVVGIFDGIAAWMDAASVECGVDISRLMLWSVTCS